jgi:hypothetical protein
MKVGMKVPSAYQESMVSRRWTRFLVVASVLGNTVSFSFQHGIRTSTPSSSLAMKGDFDDFLSKMNPKEFDFLSNLNPKEFDFLSNLNPFGKDTSASESSDTPADDLIDKAKAVIATDLAIQDPSLLDETFIWIGPFSEKPLGKTDYLAAGRFFNLRTAFPDLDYRPHDFRLDKNDPLTVRCTVRPQGVMKGPLRLRTGLVQPNGNRLIGPPEAISMTFDPENGKVVKMCSGFALDRLVGNTNGLCGVKAAAAIAGVPPSDWEVYPLPTLIARRLTQPVEPLGEVSTFLAPFPETVMIQSVKAILAANLAADDPSLLAKNFSFITPTVGPIDKSTFLESFASEEFGGFKPELSNFRVDPFDPYRVWVDVRPVGPGLEGPPQALSFTVDNDGLCARMTAGAVMDPTIGTSEAVISIAMRADSKERFSFIIFYLLHS